jgi:hypothetical protein
LTVHSENPEKPVHDTECKVYSSHQESRTP